MKRFVAKLIFVSSDIGGATYESLPTAPLKFYFQLRSELICLRTSINFCRITSLDLNRLSLPSYETKSQNLRSTSRNSPKAVAAVNKDPLGPENQQ